MQAKAVAESVERLAVAIQDVLANDWLRDDVYLENGDFVSRTRRREIRREVRRRQRRERGALGLYQEGFMARALGKSEQWPDELSDGNYFYDKRTMWLAGWEAADGELREAVERKQRWK